MSKKRLIDANALKKRIINFCGCVPYVEERKGGSRGILYLNEAIDSAPTVPAEVVVHCENCQHSQYDALFGGYWCNGKNHGGLWFCADGKRRESEAGK